MRIVRSLAVLAVLFGSPLLSTMMSNTAPAAECYAAISSMATGWATAALARAIQPLPTHEAAVGRR